MQQGHVIEIIKARQHNLQGIDIQIPVGKITVITGISGSGKSTLAMDVLFAEGQYRYLQSLSQDAWASMKLWDRPDVESISSLPPPVALEQKRPHGHYRSTVATLTGTKSLLRMLFATAGTALCPSCRKPLRASSIDQIVDHLLQLGEGTKLILLSPVTLLFQSMPFEKAIETVREQGFLRVMVNGQQVYTDQPADHHEPIEEALLVIDRLIIKPGIIGRLTDSAQLALRAGNGMLIAEVMQRNSGQSGQPKHLLTFTERPICKQCHRTFPDLEPAFFSMIEQCADQQLEKFLPPHMSAAEFREFIGCVDLAGVTWRQIFKLTLHDLLCWITTVQTSMSENGSWSMAGHRMAAERLLRAISDRILPATQMNLSYLTLERQASTLSTGEVQRIRIGEQLARNMSGILYIMDEPTTGLHPAEHQAVWQQIEKLCAAGNTVLIIEHDTGFMERAHHIVELGPGAGEQGGRVIFSGTPQAIRHTDRDTASGPWLSGKKGLNRDRLTPGRQGWISLEGLKANNLKDIAIKIPVACLTSVVGPSGSGKSSLAQDIAKQLPDNAKAERTGDSYGQGKESIARVLIMDQSAISGSATSMPATWMGIFGSIRRLFARTPEARKRGITAGWFSLAKKGGRCERCRGKGFLATELKFLPPVQSMCDVCSGTRYNRDALSVTYKGKTISEVLEMTVCQAAGFFSKISAIHSPLEWLERAGLGYLKLGQPTNTLSGGEAQRLKLAKELAKSNQQKTMYIFDEPTMGLHLEDVTNILEIFNDLLELGHTVMVAEHDPRLIAVSDWVIELGPGGGPDGGRITFQGAPEEMAKAEKSVTGRFLQGLVPDTTQVSCSMKMDKKSPGQARG